MTQKPRRLPGKVRIIGGQWRGRRICVPLINGLRPTPDRVRETLFNWLQPVIEGACCLDLFAGSGALGFEAASRGAAKVVMIEHDERAYQGLVEQATRFAADTVELVQADALEWLHGAQNAFDVVFLDPPFAGKILARATQLLHDRHWLGPRARIYIESDQTQGVSPVPKSWVLKKKGAAGSVQFRLFEERGESLER